MARPTVLPCSVFGGRSPLTGKRVGERHRWPHGWGKGACLFCHHFLEDVLRRPPPPPPTVQTLTDEARAKVRALVNAEDPRDRELLGRAIETILTSTAALAAWPPTSET